VPFSQQRLKIDNKRLFEEHVCQVHVSLVAFNRHLQLSNLGLTMLETAIVLIVGIALGYGVREWLSRRRRQAERQRRQAAFGA
jgi:type II secretory pathway pseudopilin PulG